MPQKQPIKQCHECRHFLPSEEDPAADPRCGHAIERKSLDGYPILQTVKFQRASGFLNDCGPGANFWEARL